MTPQEKDLITSLLNRLQQSGQQPKDAEADALIRQGMATTPDAPYLLVQTVLIQDMALSDAQRRIKDLEQKLAAASAAPAQQQPTSFLGRLLGGGAAAPATGAPVSGAPGPGSAPAAGPWGGAPQQQSSGPVWTQSSGPAPGPQYQQPQYAPPQYQQPQYPQPLAAPGASSGFLRSAATTAAGIAGGALLFEGIQSMFGQHYGSGFMSGTPMQPGIGETVINNYYGSDNGSGSGAAGYNPSDYAPPDYPPPDAPPSDYRSADYSQPDPSDYGQQDASDQDYGSDQDFGGNDDNYDV